MQTKISVNIVAHSKNKQGDELISVLATFPRIILAEVNTHRMLSKNTASSRAIPFKKMVQTIKENPFIPIAWQEDHSGMQGTKYLDPGYSMQATTEWLMLRDYATAMAEQMNQGTHVTKQLCNRPLETFMWTTMLITGPREGWENFFALRCPNYQFHDEMKEPGEWSFRSRKDVVKYFGENEVVELESGNVLLKDLPDLEWMKLNTGQAEIHMMDLAEKIYDALNESTAKQLQAGQWHIPFEDKINEFKSDFNHLIQSEKFDTTKDYIPVRVKISTAMAARTSYTVVGEEKSLDLIKMMELHDRLINQNPPHSSPMEHCAKAMYDYDYETNVKGVIPSPIQSGDLKNFTTIPPLAKGWCRNFKGFISYRHLVESTI